MDDSDPYTGMEQEEQMSLPWHEIHLLPGNAKEYFCTKCLQLRLSFVDVVSCKNCGSDRIITDLPGKLDKQALVSKYNRKGATMATVIRVDFTGIESGGNRNPRVPEGDYGLECTSVKLKKGGDSSKPYLDLVFKTFKGNKKGLNKSFHHSCSLQKQALWNLRNLLEAMGMTVPSKAVKLPIEKLKGKKCAGTLVDDEYENRKKSTIAGFFPLADLGKTSDTDEGLDDEEEEMTEETEEEETEAPPKKKKKKPAVEETEEEEETTEEEEEEAPPSKKKSKKKKPAVEEESEEETTDDEEELFS